MSDNNEESKTAIYVISREYIKTHCVENCFADETGNPNSSVSLLTWDNGSRDPGEPDRICPICQTGLMRLYLDDKGMKMKMCNHPMCGYPYRCQRVWESCDPLRSQTENSSGILDGSGDSGNEESTPYNVMTMPMSFGVHVPVSRSAHMVGKIHRVTYSDLSNTPRASSASSSENLQDFGSRDENCVTSGSGSKTRKIIQEHFYDQDDEERSFAAAERRYPKRITKRSTRFCDEMADNDQNHLVEQINEEHPGEVLERRYPKRVTKRSTRFGAQTVDDDDNDQDPLVEQNDEEPSFVASERRYPKRVTKRSTRFGAQYVDDDDDNDQDPLDKQNEEEPSFAASERRYPKRLTKRSTRFGAQYIDDEDDNDQDHLDKQNDEEPSFAASERRYPKRLTKRSTRFGTQTVDDEDYNDQDPLVKQNDEELPGEVLERRYPKRLTKPPERFGQQFVSDEDDDDQDAFLDQYSNECSHNDVLLGLQMMHDMTPNYSGSGFAKGKSQGNQKKEKGSSKKNQIGKAKECCSKVALEEDTDWLIIQ